MIFASLTYLIISLLALSSLTIMILRIGALVSTCDGNPGAKTAAVSIATGFSAIGFGLILIVGAGMALFAGAPFIGMLATSGFTALCLGLGFTQAVSTLRAVLTPPPAQASAPKSQSNTDFVGPMPA